MGRSLPLSLRIVGTAISQLTMGALSAEKGVVGGEQKIRAVERFEDLVLLGDLVFRENSVLLCVVGGLRDCPGGAMALSLTRPRLNLFPSTSEIPNSPVHYQACFAQLATGSSNSPLFLLLNLELLSSVKMPSTRLHSRPYIHRLPHNCFSQADILVLSCENRVQNSRRVSSPRSVHSTVHIRPANFTGTRGPSVFDLQIEGKRQSRLISV